MKKILCAIAFVLVIGLATSCGNKQCKDVVVEEETVEAVDTLGVEAPVDTLAVVAE